MSIIRRNIVAAQTQEVKGDEVKAAKNMAFVFDIDVVLVHGDRLIPEDKGAPEILDDNGLEVKIPRVFLTNGSGKIEQECCAQSFRILGSLISTNQFIQSRTPMQALTEYYPMVLVIGGEGKKCCEVVNATASKT